MESVALFPPITIYYVVPLMGDTDERVVRCQYFRIVDPGKGSPIEWISVPSTELSTMQHDIVYITQPSPDEAKSRVPNVDPTLKLFAAVAKTCDANRSMPNLVSATDCRLSIAVYPGSRRSVVLIFQRFDTVTGKFGQLIASADPDVPHGSYEGSSGC